MRKTNSAILSFFSSLLYVVVKFRNFFHPQPADIKSIEISDLESIVSAVDVIELVVQIFTILPHGWSVCECV